MRAEKDNYPVKMMARVLKASRPGFYSWLAKGEPEDPWAEPREAAWRVWLESDRTFGARFVLAFLPGEFAGTTLYRVRKCMRELGIRGIAPNSKKRTTIPDENAPARPDLTKRDFASPVPTYKPVGDITYLKAKEGWLYLAMVIDLCTRMVVGWAVSERMTAGIVSEALERAWRRGYVAGNAIFHSDRGSQHTSRLLAGWAEEARSAVIHFIEYRYNRHRPHSTIGNEVPGEAMDAFFERTKPAEIAVDRHSCERKMAA